MAEVDEEVEEIPELSDEEILSRIADEEAEEELSILFDLEYKNDEWYIDVESTTENIDDM